MTTPNANGVEVRRLRVDAALKSCGVGLHHYHWYSFCFFLFIIWSSFIAKIPLLRVSVWACLEEDLSLSLHEIKRNATNKKKSVHLALALIWSDFEWFDRKSDHFFNKKYI